MANMSYCRFQNTISDLRDCQTALGDVFSLNELDPDEAKAAKKLIYLCRDIWEDWMDIVGEEK